MSPASSTSPAKVRLDRDVCTGHGRCYTLAPEVFDADDEGYGVLVAIGGEVPAGQVEAASRAVRNCPERAITLEP